MRKAWIVSAYRSKSPVSEVYIMGETKLSYMCCKEGGSGSFVLRKKDMGKGSNLRMFMTRDEAYRWVISEAENAVARIAEHLDMAKLFLDEMKDLYAKGENHE